MSTVTTTSSINSTTTKKHVKTPAFKRLVIAVRTINPKAASYLNGKQIQQLPSFHIPDYGDTFPAYYLLERLFYWTEAKQGHNFWSAICCELLKDAGRK